MPGHSDKWLSLDYVGGQTALLTDLINARNDARLVDPMSGECEHGWVVGRRHQRRFVTKQNWNGCDAYGIHLAEVEQMPERLSRRPSAKCPCLLGFSETASMDGLSLTRLSRRMALRLQML